MTVPATGAALRDAATAIPLRDGADGLEVLMVHKGPGGQFHAGNWVFPGGKVDPEDWAGLDPDDRLGACARAAVRETLEEAALTLDPESLVAYAHWTTPVGAPRRFATWFFLARLAGGDRDDADVPHFDGAEIQDARWMSPSQVLDLHHGEKLTVSVPQYISLLGLTPRADVASALDAARRSEPLDYLGQLRTDDAGRLVFVYQPDAALDGAPLDTAGPRHRVIAEGRRMIYERD